MSDPDSSALPSPDRADALPALRASDVERERAADQLRHAAGDGRLTVDELDERLTRCYAAKTVAELAELTADVVISGRDPVPGSARARAVVVKPGRGGSSTIVSILSGSDRSGHWRVAPRLKVISVLGGSDIDLTEAEFAAPVTEITVFSLMGGGDVNQGRKLTKAERRLKKARERGELSGR